MTDAWYHCGRCGSLFQSGFGPDKTRCCETCNQKPGIGLWPVESATPETEIFSKKGEHLDEGGARAVRKKRRANTMLRVVIVWTMIMVLLVGLRNYNARNDKVREEQETVAGKMTKGTLADERIATLKDALPECHQALAGFLMSGTPEARNQFVVNPIEMAGKMAAFYANNPLPNVDVKKLYRIDQSVIKVGKEWMVETRWKEKDGLEFDAIFRRDRGIWRLDWEHFSRYSDFPWTLFLAGEGPGEAEFRLLARQRLKEDEAEQSGARLTFVMYAPEFGKPLETGMESPEFVVDRRSDEGLLLEAAFKSRNDDERIFDENLSHMEGMGLVRLRVRVSRDDGGIRRKFVLDQILACHWIDTDEMGYDIKKLKDDLFGNR